MMILLPEQCRAARGLLNWTQAQLAEHAGVSRSTVRDFERGRHEPHRATEALLIQAPERGGIHLLPAEREGPGVRMRRA
jgi:transcriptional regulator with XRE-family HTH domain